MYRILGSDQKIYGPVSAAQLRQWQAEGRVNAATMVLAEGGTDWKPLGSLADFAMPPVISYSPRPVACGSNLNLATAGLICGILANLCCCFGWIFSILGIVFSAIALSRSEADPHSGGKGVAVAGLVLSILGLAWHLFLPMLFAFPGSGDLDFHRHFHHFRWH